MIKAKTKNGCTGCRYCMPCPFGIDIPGNFKLWNEYGMLGLKDTAKRRYTNLGDAQAEFCKKCGKCGKNFVHNLLKSEKIYNVSFKILRTYKRMALCHSFFLYYVLVK